MLQEASMIQFKQAAVPFWSGISAWRDVSEEQFGDWLWQERNAITNADELAAVLRGIASDEMISDLRAGLLHAPMAMRLTPYLVALIDWSTPESDPLRRQFLPLRSEMVDPHPLLKFDSLDEHADMKVPGLVHRYRDRALFLATDHCPVYCRFCTRSYSVGVDTEVLVKDRHSPTRDRWRKVFDHVRSDSTINDIVVSGGDCFRLKPAQIKEIGEELISIPHVRRIRFATKGLAIQPMKITSATDWTDALTNVCDLGRKRQVEVCLHTHFNHPNEITGYTVEAARLLFGRGITVRNQAVLLRGVNDDARVLSSLVKQLSDLHIHPYYVYACDLVHGIEDMRLSVRSACLLEKMVRGITAGFNTPAFVVDTPGGGGKRVVHSYDLYDADLGLAVYSAPSVKPGQFFVYPDPLSSLSPARREEWRNAKRADEMVRSVVDRARAGS